jgi:hypothetical protein
VNESLPTGAVTEMVQARLLPEPVHPDVVEERLTTVGVVLDGVDPLTDVSVIVTDSVPLGTVSANLTVALADALADALGEGLMPRNGAVDAPPHAANAATATRPENRKKRRLMVSHPRYKETNTSLLVSDSAGTTIRNDEPEKSRAS